MFTEKHFSTISEMVDKIDLILFEEEREAQELQEEGDGEAETIRTICTELRMAAEHIETARRWMRRQLRGI